MPKLKTDVVDQNIIIINPVMKQVNYVYEEVKSGAAAVTCRVRYQSQVQTVFNHQPHMQNRGSVQLTSSTTEARGVKTTYQFVFQKDRVLSASLHHKHRITERVGRQLAITRCLCDAFKSTSQLQTAGDVR